MNTLIPGAPLRSLSPTSIEYQRAQGASRAAKPARAARFTLDAPEHSGTIPGAIGDILPPGVALTSNLAVIFTLNQYKRTSVYIVLRFTVNHSMWTPVFVRYGLRFAICAYTTDFKEVYHNLSVPCNEARGQLDCTEVIG